MARIRLLDNDYWSIGESVNDSDRTPPWVVDEFTATSAHYWTAPTISGLEAEVGLPPGFLMSTVDSYNAAARAPRQVDPEHRRNFAGPRAIERRPFHAIQYFPLVQKNLGGIRTDGHARGPRRARARDRGPLRGRRADGHGGRPDQRQGGARGRPCSGPASYGPRRRPANRN
ncbi:FAD-binding protein [Micromonospora sp. NPDC005299]|uniref:FAD-binding protein n=1 Tax=Micromonospora sp. NPDC005299 TaxID=3364231 RepID=UPI003682BD33